MTSSRAFRALLAMASAFSIVAARLVDVMLFGAVPRGFVQEEYLLSGMARPYYGPSVFAQRPVAGTAALPLSPYTTRIIVVRPTKPQRSNHTAVVTWENVTFGHDIDEWFDIGRQVAADGYTYVDASVQIASEPALKAFDPVRYATVDIPDDAYSYDIYSQVAQAMRHRDGIPGTPLRHVLALGASQSGFALDQYLADVQPVQEHVYDGFLDAVANGPDHHNDRPVIRLLSEDEIDGTSTSPDGKTYRQWEVAGSSHGNKADFDYIAATERRDLGADLVDPLAGDNAPFGTSSCKMNRFPADEAYSAALVALRRWVVEGKAPAPQPRVKVVAGTIMRDKVGNAIGGIRLPAVSHAPGLRRRRDASSTSFGSCRRADITGRASCRGCRQVGRSPIHPLSEERARCVKRVGGGT